MRRLIACLGAASLLVGIAGLFPTVGHGQIFHRNTVAEPRTYGLVEIGRMIDRVEDSIRDDGVVVIKQPDVWSQARMSKYRLDFEKAFTPPMTYGNDGFMQTLQAVIARSDMATFQSETALSAVLTPTPRGANGRRQPITIAPDQVPSNLTSLSTNVLTSGGFLTPDGKPATVPNPTIDTTAFNLTGKVPPFATSIATTKDGKPVALPAVSLEPTVVLDEHKRYLDHMNEIRRVNMGDDIADSAGYGLYLLRMPVSIQPGEQTYKGWGAQATVTARHEFKPDFLNDTYKTLVVNDLVDQLAPVIYELIRGGYGDYRKRLVETAKQYREQSAKAAESNKLVAQLKTQLGRQQAELNQRQKQLDQLRQTEQQLRDAEQQLREETAALVVDIVKKEVLDPSKPVPQLESNLQDILKSRPTAATDQYQQSVGELASQLPAFGNGPPSLEEQKLREKEIPSDLAAAVMKKLSSPVADSSQLVKGLVPPGVARRNADEIDQKVNQLNEDRKRIADLAERVKSIQENYNDLLKLESEARAQVEYLSSAIRDTEGKIVESTRALEQLQTGLSERAAFRGELPSTRLNNRLYPVAPSDLFNVFLWENLLLLAEDANKASLPKTVRATDVQAFLHHELQAAYDLMTGNCPGGSIPLGDTQFIENVRDLVQCRKYFDAASAAAVPPGPSYSSLQAAYRGLIAKLPFGASPRADLNSQDFLDQFIRSLGKGGVEATTGLPDLGVSDPDLPLKNRDNGIGPLGPLCWAIAVDAGLLNRRLREDVQRYAGQDGFDCPADLGTVFFYVPMPRSPAFDERYAQAEGIFESYVRTRWKMITFALDPFTDQQNIGDAFSRTRVLELAIAYGFAAGRINFQQLNRYRRQLQYEATTIGLNRTVTSFAYGFDTFGWRFAPRYQTPPEERSNIQVLTNLIYRGGPGRNYQISNSKLEAGLRELTAIVIMPSFLQQVRFDVEGCWYRLHDPDEVKPHTAHKLRQGQRVVELRHALAAAEDAGCYRPGDLERLSTKVHQLEEMLPMQTRRVTVPYGNALGGFDLFSPGSTSLAPELAGFQGVDVIRDGEEFEAFLYGKNVSLQETKVIVGGKKLDGTADSPDVEILSREVVRIKVPKEARPAVLHGEDHQDYVEVYLATPNGISNRLLIPFGASKPAPDPTKTPAPAAQATGGASYTLADDTLTVAGAVQPQEVGDTIFVPRPYGGGEHIRILAIKPVADPKAKLKANFLFPLPDVTLSVMVPVDGIGYDDKQHCYVIGKDQLDKFAADLFQKLRDNGVLKSDGKFTSKLASRTIQVQIQDGDGSTSTTTNQLTVQFALYLEQKKPKPKADEPAPSKPAGGDATKAAGASPAKSAGEGAATKTSMARPLRAAPIDRAVVPASASVVSRPSASPRGVGASSAVAGLPPLPAASAATATARVGRGAVAAPDRPARKGLLDRLNPPPH